MLYSMTGFGKSEQIIDNQKISIQIKTLNSKQNDLFTRLPSAYKSSEIKIRTLISEQLHRGKMEVNLHVEQLGSEQFKVINHEALKHYLEALKNYGSQAEVLPTLLKFPDVFEQKNQDDEAIEWKAIQTLVEQACAEVQAFRLQEGEKTAADFRHQIQSILDDLKAVEPFENERIEKLRARLDKHLGEAIEKEQIDQNRFEQELIFYIEKFDISEEKMRLKSHCDYFVEFLDNDQISKGKKLSFICQEIGREINTLGSKANHAEIQKLVIQMKDNLEKIKEQVLNIL
ncbi:MAG: YicC/YloC family endoribonuclease [Flavobacteriales bacterium]